MIPDKHSFQTNEISLEFVNQVINDDVIKSIRKLPNDSIDLIILDPPYFKTVNQKWDFQWRVEEDYIKWFKEIIIEVSRVSKPTGCIYLFGYLRMLYELIPIVIDSNFEFRQQLVINKGLQSIGGRKTSTYRMFPTTTESIIFFNYNIKPTIKKFLKKLQRKQGLTAYEINHQLGVKTNGGGVWSLYTGNNILQQVPTKEKWEKLQKILDFNIPYDRVSFTFNRIMGLTDVWDDIDFYKEKRVHQTQKPLKLIERLILSSSKPGMIVLDPFMGSGTSAIACMKNNRNFLGFEKDQKYYSIACDRIQHYINNESDPFQNKNYQIKKSNLPVNRSLGDFN